MVPIESKWRATFGDSNEIKVGYMMKSCSSSNFIINFFLLDTKLVLMIHAILFSVNKIRRFRRIGVNKC